MTLPVAATKTTLLHTKHTTYNQTKVGTTGPAATSLHDTHTTRGVHTHGRRHGRQDSKTAPHASCTFCPAPPSRRRFVSFRFVSFRFVSFRFISFALFRFNPLLRLVLVFLFRFNPFSCRKCFSFLGSCFVSFRFVPSRSVSFSKFLFRVLFRFVS